MGGSGQFLSVAAGGAIVTGRPASRFGVVSETSAELGIVGFLLVGVIDPSLEEECLRFIRFSCIPPGKQCR